MTKTYFPEVDVVKGIAILLVMLGHSFCSYPIDLGSQFPTLGDVVRSFQMPLFFIASGFLFSLSTPLALFLRKKARRLLIPLIVFALLSVGLKFAFSSITRGGQIVVADALFDIVQGHYYWFLYSLLWIMGIALLVKRHSVLAALAIACVAACLLTDVYSVEFFTIGRTVYYFPFFVVGLLFRQGYGYIKKIPTGYWALVALLLAAVYVTLMALNGVQHLASAYVIGLTGSLVVWLAVLPLTKFELRPLKHFGHYSLQYYLNHLLIMLPCYYAGGRLFTPPICSC